MEDNKSIRLFEDKQIRTAWDEEQAIDRALETYQRKGKQIKKSGSTANRIIRKAVLPFLLYRSVEKPVFLSLCREIISRKINHEPTVQRAF